MIYARIAAALVLAAFLAALYWRGYTQGSKSVQREWDLAIAQQTQDALKASEDARRKEQELSAAVARIGGKYAKESANRAVADKRAADLGVRLQTIIANGDAKPSNPASATGSDDPRDRIIAECAGTAIALDQAARRLAAKTSTLQDYADNVCISK